ncbi:MAG: hypothetical protein QOH71_3750 [Blastocatellia bacterium]|nr:hypothetical protein [Blastocatellia bacterium]
MNDSRYSLRLGALAPWRELFSRKGAKLAKKKNRQLSDLCV